MDRVSYRASIWKAILNKCQRNLAIMRVADGQSGLADILHRKWYHGPCCDKFNLMLLSQYEHSIDGASVNVWMLKLLC